MTEKEGPLWRRLDWRRWLGAYKRTTLPDQRRAWVRHPANVLVSFQPADAAEQPRAAFIRNISLGGINLVVDQPFASGALLEIHIDSNLVDTPENLLVRVIHVTETPEGQWSLGCAFARELDDEGLRALQADRVRSRPADKRAWVRFASPTAATLESANGAAGPLPATILDVSPGGVGLLVSRPFERGTILSLELPLPGNPDSRHVLARVVHVHDRGGKAWVLGCSFTRQLRDDELLALRPPAAD